jgi:hypothetical protein
VDLQRFPNKEISQYKIIDIVHAMRSFKALTKAGNVEE